jgi:hypothetical protein
MSRISNFRNAELRSAFSPDLALVAVPGFVVHALATWKLTEKTRKFPRQDANEKGSLNLSDPFSKHY